MPYSIQPGDIIEVRLNMRMNGQRLMNVCHYRNGEDEVADAQTALQNTLDELFDAPGGSVSDAYLDNATDDLTLDYADAQVIYPLRRAYERYLIGTNCSAVSTPLPQNIQGSITKRSTFAGAGSEGRIEVPGLTVDHVTAGMMTTAGLAFLNDVATAWIVPLTLGTFVAAARPIIYHRANPNTSVTWETITLQPQSRVARRRTVGLGE